MDHNELEKELLLIDKKIDTHIIECTQVRIRNDASLSDLKEGIRNLRNMIVLVLLSIFGATGAIWSYVEFKSADRYTKTEHMKTTLPRLERLENKVYLNTGKNHNHDKN